MKGYHNMPAKSGKKSTGGGGPDNLRPGVTGKPTNRTEASPSKNGMKSGSGGGLPQRPGGGQSAGHSKVRTGKNRIGSSSPSAMRG